MPAGGVASPGNLGAARSWMWLVWVGLRVFGRSGLGGMFGVCRRRMRAAGLLLARPTSGQARARPSALPGVAFVPYAGAVPDGGRRGFEAAVAVRAPIV
jgi:hypothetical protein